MGNEIFGLNEEMRDEKTETKKKVRKPFVPWEVGGTEYRLKLTTNAIVKLENKYGKNVLSIVSPEEGLPPVGDLLTVIQAAMDKLMEHRTSFVIAHRLSTIRDADLILAMKDGDIIESGTHEALLAKQGFYADLYNSQFEQAS